jgi:hypothetical protein
LDGVVLNGKARRAVDVMKVVPDADSIRRDVIARDYRRRVRRDIAAVIFDDDTAADSGDDVVRHIKPRVIGNPDALSKESAQDIVDLVGIDAAVVIARTAKAETVEPDAELADVLNDVVFDDRV